jgi:hypothetical protein
MGLNFGSQVFGLEFLDSKRFTAGFYEHTQRIIAPGMSITPCNCYIYAHNLGNNLNVLGFEVTIEICSNMVAARNVTLTLNNVTKSTTIYSQSITLNEGVMASQSFFFPLESINPGDGLELVLTGDSLGTKAGGTYLGYMGLGCRVLFEMQSEEQ